VFVRRDILEAGGEAFRSVRIDRIGQQLAIVGDRKGPKAEVLEPLGKYIFVEDQLRFAAANGLAVIFAILRTLFEF